MKLNAYKKQLPRWNVSFEILALILISTQCFEIVPLEGIFLNNGAFTFYMLAMAFIYMRNMGFQIRYGIFPKLKPMWLILAGVLISFIPAYLYYGQHLYHSLVVYRQFAGYLVLPLLLSVRPSNLELKRAFYLYVFIYFFALLWLTYVKPEWATIREGMDLVNEGDFFHTLPGDQFLLPALIFALDDYRNKKKNRIRYGLLSLFIFLVIFLIQSRTILMASGMVLVFAALTNKSIGSRMASEVILVFLGLAFFALASPYITAMITETTSQLSDPDYNRVKAFMYFTSGVNGWPSFLWGNGLISGKVHPLMEQLRNEGIFNSDLGLIGMWNQFGLIPSLTILVFVFSGLSSKRSFIVRANALYILVGALSISYFYILRYSLWLCLYFYLYYSDAAYKERMEKIRQKKLRGILRRYRSIAS